MNKSSPEYLRVREEIAKWLAMRFVYGRDNEFNPLNFGGLNDNEKKQVLNDAALILTIKGIAIIADDQSLPDIECFKGQVKRILIQTNFKRMVK